MRIEWTSKFWALGPILAQLIDKRFAGLSDVPQKMWRHIKKFTSHAIRVATGPPNYPELPLKWKSAPEIVPENSIRMKIPEKLEKYP